MATRNAATKPSKVQDLDMDAIVTTERHDKDFGDLDGRICSFENRFGSNEKVADTLYDVAAGQVKMQRMHAEMFLMALKQDEAVRETIKKIVDDADRHFVREWIKKLGGTVRAILIFLLGVVATAIIGNIAGVLDFSKYANNVSPAAAVVSDSNNQ